MSLNKSITDMYKQRTAMNNNKKRPKIEPTVDKFDVESEVTLDQLFGCEAACIEIKEIVDHFQRSAEGSLGESEQPILICGSRSLGKTSLVEAASNYGKLKLVPIPLKKLASQMRSEFKERLEQLVRYSISIQPAIVLVDDLDKLGDKEELKLLVLEAIQQLVDSANNLLVFCTTPSALEDVIDINFSSVIYLKRPDLEARYKILSSIKQSFKSLTNLTETCLRQLAMNTPSFSARDLRTMLRIAERKSDGFPSIEHCKKAIDLVKLSFRRGTHLIGQKPSVTWTDIGGMSEVRLEFTKIIKRTKKDGCKFAGIALFGPPGCGKTMVAQAMANEAGFNFISIHPSELVNKFLGETEKNIRRVFQEAREHEPCMIYFDEFDGLCGTRGNKDNQTGIINTLLAEMDGFAFRGDIIILASTNRLEDIDPGIKRPGRLSHHIYVGPPNEKARKDILNVITHKPSLCIAPDVDLDSWAKKTEKFTGAELHFLVAEAEQEAIRQSDLSDEFEQPITLLREHFELALDKIKTTNSELSKKMR